MRLIHTRTLQLHEFMVDELPPYVVLSHRWRSGSGNEATLQEFEGYLRNLRRPERYVLTTSITDSPIPKRTSILEWIGSVFRWCTDALCSCFGNESLYEESLSEGEHSRLLTSDIEPEHRYISSWYDESVQTSSGIQKVLDFCRKASENDFSWAWIDTVCIDKTNLVELSEAINSMYQWYHNSDACFAYLHDVNSDDGPEARRRSDWFTRGWTLQELIAPCRVTFYSSSWTEIGNRDSMQEELSAITSIPVAILSNPDRITLYTSAQRISWAACRETTRGEDMAYCLLGLLNVRMDLSYGEGAVEAFRRLQLRALTEFNDESLLAWECCENDFPPQGEVHVKIFEIQPSGEGTLFEDELYGKCAFTGVLAALPRHFWCAGRTSDSGHYVPEMPMEITSWGMKLEREVRELENVSARWLEQDVENETDALSSSTTPVMLVPLSCKSKDAQEGSYIFVTQDYTSKVKNRWCRIHFDAPFADHLTRKFLDNDCAKCNKKFFIRMSWPQQPVVGHSKTTRESAKSEPDLPFTEDPVNETTEMPAPRVLQPRSPIGG